MLPGKKKEYEEQGRSGHFAVWAVIFFFPVFPLWRMCSPSKKCQNGVPGTWEMFELRVREGVRLC